MVMCVVWHDSSDWVIDAGGSLLVSKLSNHIVSPRSFNAIKENFVPVVQEFRDTGGCVLRLGVRVECEGGHVNSIGGSNESG